MRFPRVTRQRLALLSRSSAQEGAVSATDVAMQQVPADISSAFQRRLDQAQVPADQRPDYHKWVRFYFDFCHKYGHSPAAPTSLGPFLTKLASKSKSVFMAAFGYWEIRRSCAMI